MISFNDFSSNSLSCLFYYYTVINNWKNCRNIMIKNNKKESCCISNVMNNVPLQNEYLKFIINLYLLELITF